MQTQVRKNILSNKWEVQLKEAATAHWTKQAEFATKEQADNYALAMKTNKANKSHTQPKKNAQNARKTAKKGKGDMKAATGNAE